MTQIQRTLRLDEARKAVEKLVVEQSRVPATATRPRMILVERAPSSVQDDLDDLWDNVPL